MITIWKYPLAPGATEHKIPRGARFLSVQVQGNGLPPFREGNVCMWFLVDTDKTLERRQFVVYGTGHEVHDARFLVHLGTFQFPGLVFHAFESDPPRGS